MQRDDRPLPEPDEYGPVLPGDAPSDYERYLRTPELLALQKDESERIHRDELLFQVTHQTAELWLKLAAAEVEEAVALVSAGSLGAARRLLARVSLALALVTSALDMLERMSPWEYQEIRKVLGHGSGFDSPGWRRLRRLLIALGAEVETTLHARGLAVRDVYVDASDHPELYELAEAVLEVDERAQLWRMRHFQVISRVIGDSVVGTQGTPVEVLGRLVTKRLYPQLWQARNELTELAGAG